MVEVASLLPRGQEPVFNIEVEGDHCYRVGECGVLVHNASVFCPDEAERSCSEFNDIGEFCRDPDFRRRYPYISAREACSVVGGRPGNIVAMNETPNDCNSSRGSRHARCFPGDKPSAISCWCCDENGQVQERWKIARSRI
ncbi:unnamed protein product [Tuwongella immobilis]|uniref:Intein C-terminal splicing domain-containing protein n=1 Tax=Tuwongella immobilis TaxID=692036 RepID=A0A6C2YRZ0_9BACT|nr:unnamed protein product [Tuwongella immobilis]VTS04858.1 unnamed protein product [Tuwongella immobilis]